LDLTDFYAFPKPGDPGKSIIVFNVHPSYSVNPPGPTTTEPFAPGAIYEVKFDTNGDAVADLAYSAQFSSSDDGKQTATLRRIQGMRAAERFSSPERNLSGEPVDDDRFVDVFAHELEHTGGYTPEDAKGIARKLLPDVLSYNPGCPASYPHNGRTLIDDVVDPFFSLLTNGTVTEDKVGPHSDLLEEFPYLAPPHE
jgi:hypothetical protein